MGLDAPLAEPDVGLPRRVVGPREHVALDDAAERDRDFTTAVPDILEPHDTVGLSPIGDVDALNIDPYKTVAYITQTTLSVDETKGIIAKLKNKFPKLIGPPRSDICYATQNRQDAIKELASFCDIIIICGSPHSSNSNRLRETGEQLGIESHIIDTAAELDCSIFKNKTKIGLSSGASVPRFLVDDIIDKIKTYSPEAVVHEFKNPEKNIVFPVLQFTE